MPCREGGKWLHERIYNDREAELPPRVDKRRLVIAEFSRGEWPQIEAAVERMRETVAALPAATVPDEEAGVLCEPKLEVTRD